jgi:hypothetical protein
MTVRALTECSDSNAFPDRLTVHLQGSVNVEAALRIAREILDVGASDVRLHFHRDAEVHDAALGVFAGALAGIGSLKLEILGLRGHHWRVLEYLGVAPAKVRSLSRGRAVAMDV